jgi:hypothetical protein
LITQLTLLGKEIPIDRERYEREGIKIWKKNWRHDSYIYFYENRKSGVVCLGRSLN